MAPFADVTLASDGDFVEGKVTMAMSGRTTTGVNTLNTQLRLGLFHNGVNAASASRSDVSVTTVPEPGPLALSAGGRYRGYQAGVAVAVDAVMVVVFAAYLLSARGVRTA